MTSPITPLKLTRQKRHGAPEKDRSPYQKVGQPVRVTSIVHPGYPTTLFPSVRPHLNFGFAYNLSKTTPFLRISEGHKYASSYVIPDYLPMISA